MHELPIVKEVLRIALDYAHENSASEVRNVVLEVGEMHDLVQEWVEKFFKFASRGTIAENSRISIAFKPIICRCGACNENFVLHIHEPEETLVCPVCHSDEFSLLSGHEFIIKEIEVV